MRTKEELEVKKTVEYLRGDGAFPVVFTEENSIKPERIKKKKKRKKS